MPRKIPSIQAMILCLILKTYKTFSREVPQDPEKVVQRLYNRERYILRLAPRVPLYISIENFHIDTTPLCKIHASNVSGKSIILYIHGGGFVICGPCTTHRGILWRLSELCGCPVVGVDYNKAPEYKYPIALDQSFTVYKDLLNKYDHSNIAIGGDSAGGNLTLALALKIKDEGMPLPSSIFAMSPFTDATTSGESIIRNRKKDALIPAEAVSMVKDIYLGDASPEDPYVSPLFGDFHGFPPTLLQVSSNEVLLDDSIRVEQKMRKSGVNAQIDVWKNLPHVWQFLYDYIPESRGAMEDIGVFVRKHFKG